MIKELEALGLRAPAMLFPEHHLSHAASAFYPSPYEEAAILTIDGVGEWATTTIGKGTGNDIIYTEGTDLSTLTWTAVFRVYLFLRVSGQWRRI